jgi:uncharacterized membrane protein YhaH (DUF805 family)
MLSPFAFQGRLRRLPYVLWSLVVFFSQHLVILAVLAASGDRSHSFAANWWFYLAPSRALIKLDHVPSILLIVLLACLLTAAWLLAALAFRRAMDAGFDHWAASLAIVPVVQVAVILALSVWPSRAGEPLRQVDRTVGEAGPRWSAAARGAIAGVALTPFAVAFSALGFGTYGFGLFVLSPFVIGATTAYLANRRHDLGGRETALLVAGATALGGLVLIAVALEGVVCIVMAAPLGFGVALIGGLAGRAAALTGRRSSGQTLAGIAILPLVFAAESLFPATTSFNSLQTIRIDAPPAVVWKAIVHLEAIDAPPALPFRLGVAYPVRGEIIGEGVGAMRRGEFSTGTALERVTEWIPERKLGFVVVEDVPAMHELSPYQHVHAPHVVGYFATTYTSFELVALPDGRTEVIEHTSHALRLDPVLYWLPMARSVVAANNARVLAHIRRQAEAGARPGTSAVIPAERSGIQ